MRPVEKSTASETNEGLAAGDGAARFDRPGDRCRTTMGTFADDHRERMERARVSLQGLSVGDAFGERFFISPSTVESLIEQRALPSAPWSCTDDTVMALSIVDVLQQHGHIDQDLLATLFARRYTADIRRGYGGTAHDILRSISLGEPWREVASAAFDGMGSMGNGAAMRAAPIGAYFEGDVVAAARQAALSADVTHANVEGRAGAIAVAVAAANVSTGSTNDMFAAVLSETPLSETRDGIAKASVLPIEYDVRTAVAALGNGSRVLSQDTVPFALWCAAKCFHSFSEALWTTVAGLGDRDTTCAIVGGILCLRNEAGPIPHEWLLAREPLTMLPGTGNI
jgi:ADP-ribosylglycohydrolase